VSVLFADLVGFTALSESRDPEEVRELLSRYFDTCRRLIGLYGGVVEKFIGDAVMAVWGTPVATEDDAERAVRTALDLTAAVQALGQEAGIDGLRARAGVMTGEAAVNMGAVGEGMVAGDLVNTASRVQSVSEPGAVFVVEATRRATERAIVYEEAGSHELKGKEGQTGLWRALRVASGVGGELRSEGLEAPFVGRDRELRQIKDLFHDCAEEQRAQLVSVTGIAGIGKSRLAWEFYKYFDGLSQIVYWHRGRCLAYGEGVTYWALADMVRMRCGIAEDDPQEEALRKLQAALDEHLLDPEERRFVEPRLAQLLALGEGASHERQDLFAATGDVDGIGAQGPKLGLIHALEAAHILGQRGKTNELLEIVDRLSPGLRPPLLEATANRFRARLAGDDPGADRHFAAAAAQLRGLDLPFHAAVVQLEYGEWLTARGRPDDAQPLLAEARDTFERLQAAPWLERADAVAPGAAAEVGV
jgi:class 3 adenylate cyclase